MTNTRTKIGVILAAVIMLFAGLAATNGTATAKQASTTDKCYEKVTEYKYVKYTRTKQRQGTRDHKNDEWNWSDWSSYSAWTPWGDGNQHLTWSTQNTPTLNDPAEHGHWFEESENHKSVTEYFRQWQLHNTGDTRVVNGNEVPCPTVPPTTTEAPTTVATTTLPPTTTEAPTTTQPDKKVLICHRDQGKPEWKVIEISESALPAHLSHQWGEDIYPVPAEGCPVLPTEPPTTSTTTLPPTTTVPPTEPPTTTTPEQPDDKVTVSEWIDGEFECGDTTVQQYRTTTTTPYVLVDGQWVLSETSTVTYEYRTRQLTADEQYACPTEPPTTVAPTTEPPATNPSTVPPTVPVQPTFVWGSACGIFTGTAVNDSTANAVFQVHINGSLDKTVTVLPGQKYVYEKRFTEDTGVYTVQVDWPGDNMVTTVASNCKPPATTAPKSAPLPNTGSNTPMLLLIGGALLAIGIAASRFRRNQSA